MRLADICEAIVDCEHKTAPEGDGFAFAVGTKAMKGGRLVLDGARPVSEETYEGWTRRMRPAPGDLILAREAPVGDVVRVPESPRICLGQRTVLIRPDESQVLPRFLHYWLLGPDAQGVMRAQTGGATVGHLNVGDIRKLDVGPMPTDPRHQAATAGLLGSIDDLVENNRRRVEVLEEMARAIYREWFVKFRYPGHEGVPLVDSALGPIPLNWEVVPLVSVASETGSGPFGSKLGRKDYQPHGVPVIRGANLRVGGGFDERDFVFVSPAKASELRSSWAMRGDILVTQRGTLGQVGMIPRGSQFDLYVLSQSQMKVTLERGRAAAEFVYAQLCSDPTVQRFVSRAMTAGVPHVNLRLLREFEILLPPRSMQGRFAEVAGPLMDLAFRLEREQLTLARLRDALLPKLVTAEIDVSTLKLDPLVSTSSTGGRESVA